MGIDENLCGQVHLKFKWILNRQNLLLLGCIRALNHLDDAVLAPHHESVQDAQGYIKIDDVCE